MVLLLFFYFYFQKKKKKKKKKKKIACFQCNIAEDLRGSVYSMAKARQKHFPPFLITINDFFSDFYSLYSDSINTKDMIFQTNN